MMQTLKNRSVLKNKNCFISGATGGFGKCLAMELAQSGCNLFLTSTNSDKLKKLKIEISHYVRRPIRFEFVF